MKVLIVVDKAGTAIDRLAQMIANHNDRHEIRILPVHPKRNDADTIYQLTNLMKWCDVLDVHYWRSGEIVKSVCPDDFKRVKKILFHFNPYDIDQQNWLDTYDKVVVGNEEIHSRIPYAHLVPYGVDLNFFKFNEEYTESKNVMMSVARIEGKKGVLEVAKACKELGYKFRLVGRVSKGEYVQAILDVGGVTFIENASDEELRDIYYTSAIHVCNSVDGFESGTLPIVESMACGLPVVTRAIGHVPDLNNGKNMVVRNGKHDDIEDLKQELKDLMENRDLRLKLRQNAWETARTRDSRMMVLKIMKLYRDLFEPEKPMVSIIIPTKDNPEALSNALIAASSQDYKKFEIIVVDSGRTSVKDIVDVAKRTAPFSVKYIYFNKTGYTLAEARNRGIIEAHGDIIVFCDERINMQSDAVTQLVSMMDKKMWVWGVKDDALKAFVENFSAVWRSDIIRIGMFNERIEWYGGMTQDVRTRAERNGIQLVLADKAKAMSNSRARSRSKKRNDIIESKYLLTKLYA